MTKIRAAIVGTGAIAHMHAEAILAYPGAELVAVVNRNPQRRADFAEKWNVANSYQTVAELFAAQEIDVVHLCTPPEVHRQQTLAAYAAGAHVICEKPPALSLAEVDDMLEAAAEHNLFYAIVFQQRSGSAAAWVKQQLAAGTFGRPLVAHALTLWHRDEAYYEVDWRGTWDGEGGGTTFGHGAHQMDLLAYLLGDWAEVDGRLWRLARDVEFEDTSTATIRFQNGAVATAVSTVLAPRETSHVRIDTELATIEVEHLYGHTNANWRITPARHVPEEVSAAWVLPAQDEGSGHIPLIRETFDAIAAGAELPDLVAHQRRSLELITALYASSTYGKPITVADLAADERFQHHLRAEVTDLRGLISSQGASQSVGQDTDQPAGQ